jgi:hypothetical protein
MQAVGTTDSLDPDRLALEADTLLGGVEAWRSQQKPHIDAMRRESRLPAQQIVRLMRI